MKTCECGNEIRDDQSICHECFQKINNLRPIGRDEIVLDCDDRENGDNLLRQVGMCFSVDGYELEVWRVQGGKSYHIHIKNIPHISELPKEQNKLYKELLLKKYMHKVVELLGYEPAGINKLDFSLCIPDHLVAEENKLHFKYKQEKKLIAIINEENLNYCDMEIYSQATQQTKKYNPKINGSGITAKIVQRISIIDMAKQFGLSVNKNKTLCPFHKDNNTPSLVFYEEQGRFTCFGCDIKGNIIIFYAMLKQLNPDFKYKKQEIKL
jgi:hypothetical protein